MPNVLLVTEKFRDASAFLFLFKKKINDYNDSKVISMKNAKVLIFPLLACFAMGICSCTGKNAPIAEDPDGYVDVLPENPCPFTGTEF